MFIWRNIFKMFCYLFYLLYFWFGKQYCIAMTVHSTQFLLLFRRQNLDMTQQDSIFTRHIFEKSYTLWRFWSDILRCHRRLWKGTHPIIITVRILLNVQFDINYHRVLQEMKKSHRLSSLLCRIVSRNKILNFAF